MTHTIPTNQQAIYIALSTIPIGKVIAYGQLAKLAGITNGARQVGRLLCELPEGSNLPWHRVVNSQGKISLPADSPSYHEQVRRLKSENVEVVNGKISLVRFGYGG